MNQTIVQFYPDATKSLIALTNALLISAAARTKKPFYLALSGGETARSLFEIWKNQYNDPKRWKNVHFFWVDERCVSSENEESNYHWAEKLFFKPVGINPNHIYRIQGEDIPYKRDAQVIIAEYKLRPYESLELDITYNGSIDENICYLDITDEEYYDTQTGSSILRFGKRYAFVQDQFTLLTPECLWYPSTFPPVNPEAPYNIRKNFSNYTLKVIHPNDRTILSQGISSQSGDTTIFRNKEQLPGISLAIGDYEKKSIVVDSVQIELYNFKGHDFYSEVFPNISDTSAGFLQDVKSEYELRKGRKYPYQKFIMAETPIAP